MAAEPLYDGKNAIQLLYEYCSKNKYPTPSFTDLNVGIGGGQSGKFCCSIRLEKPFLITATGSAHTKKLAKHVAAQMAIVQVPELKLLIQSEGNGKITGSTSSTLPMLNQDRHPISEDIMNQFALREPMSNGIVKKRKVLDDTVFPKMDPANPQAVVIQVLREMHWPERVYSAPQPTIDGKIMVFVKAGPVEESERYSATGLGERLSDAKRDACANLFVILERDPFVLREWYLMRAPESEAFKQLKAVMGNKFPDESRQEYPAQPPFQAMRSRLVDCLKELKQSRSGSSNSSSSYLPYFQVFKLVAQTLPAEINFEYTLPEESQSEDLEAGEIKPTEFTGHIKVFWTEPEGDEKDRARIVHPDGEGSNFGEMIELAAERFFLLFGLAPVQFRIPC